MRSSDSGLSETVPSAGIDSSEELSGESPAAGETSSGPNVEEPVRRVAAESELVALPDRYEIRESADERILRCQEAPGIAVRVDSTCAVTESEARRLGERVILLDGAGSFPPLLDNEGLLYNLDHLTVVRNIINLSNYT